jgi:hypothetical protein
MGTPLVALLAGTMKGAVVGKTVAIWDAMPSGVD